MNNESDSDLDERIEILKQKYLQKRNQQVPDDGGGAGEYNNRRSHRSELKNPSSVTCLMCDAAGHTRDSHAALRDIYRTLSDRPRRPDSAEDDPSDEDDPEETNVFCTETDVTLPSNLTRSPGSSVLNDGGKDCADESRSVSGSGAAVHVYQEMLHIYEKLQAERLSQQAWAAELCERERDLQHRENAVLQQQRSVHRLRGAQQEVMTHVQSLQQQYQQEKSELEAALKQKTKENKRMRSSFDSMKELNDSMKKQLNEVSEQNRKLECQSRKVQARLENLQRKYESFSTHRSRETSVPKASEPKPCKPEKPQSKQAAGKVSHGPSLKLLALLLDWLVDGQLMEVRDGIDLGAPQTSSQERCARVLPMLVEQLHGASSSAAAMESSSSSVLKLSLLRCIYCCLIHLERSSQHSVLTSTLRRLGEEVSRGSSRASPLFKSSCLHTRFLCSLIIIKTISQGTLWSFLDECGSEDFFRCASLFLRHPRLEPPLLEKMLMLLQKLSSVRKNKRLFEASSLHLLLQEMHRTSDRSQAFISMNLSSILLNLGMLTRS
ncbi:coiled-coil domain-containing protein 138-like [Garra rufa]|uniref:coiled-coil domain-containing protein 138-like n=1 Tax=Garra rufa TaxID=137080 RepID=UPI003CCEF52B